MKKIKILIVIFLCSGCLSNPPQKGLYLDVAEQLYGKESSFCLSEICDSISYIPLETHPDALLRGLNMGIKTAADYIFIQDQNAIYRFDCKGNYEGKLDKHGRGPHEFLQIMGFDINTCTHELYIYDNILGKIEVVDFNFKPLRTLQPVPLNIQDIAIDKNGHIVCGVIRNDVLAQGKTQDAIIILNAQNGHEIGKRKSKIPTAQVQGTSNFIYSTILTKYNHNIHYKEHRSDSYYLFQDTSQCDSIHFTVNVGKNYPVEWDYDETKMDKMSQYPSFDGAVETINHIFIYFRPQNENSRLACYHKKTQRLTVFPKGEFPTNDIDNGLSPKCFRKVDDKTLIEVIPAIKFIDTYRDRNTFHINEEDNPILMLIHLKE